MQRIKLMNFKSFKKLDFELKSLNILIGRNGAGKSNLLDFFRLLRDAADLRLRDRISSWGGLKEVRWRGSSQNETLEWELAFINLRQHDGPIYHRASLAPRGNSYTVRLEEVSRDPYRGHTEEYRFLGYYDGFVRYLAAKPGSGKDEETVVGNSDDYNYNDQELLIAQLRDPVHYPLLDEVRSLMSDWTIFRGFGENALKNIYDSQSLDVVSPLRLDPEARNLVSVLHTLDNDPRYASSQEELEAVLRQAFPEFGKLRFNLTATGRAELQWREKNGWQFPASKMSDGMLRFLGLATLLVLPDPPLLIAIDEPEVGLHPELISLLGGLLKAASARTQVIVASHSPQLLNADDIELEDVVVVERSEGETQFARLDHDDLGLWLERYALGNLWTMGKLEHS